MTVRCVPLAGALAAALIACAAPAPAAAPPSPAPPTAAAPTAAAPTAAAPTAAGPDGVRVWRAVAFTPEIPCGRAGPAPARTCKLTMDVFAPAAPGPWPLVVLLPGGPKPPSGYTYVNDGALAIARSGAVVMNAGWRMSAEYRGGWKSSFRDVACAIGVARATGASYGADPAHVTLAAHSLGGWVAAVVALTPEPFTPRTGRCAATAGSLRPDALVTIAGAVDEIRNQGMGTAYLEAFMHGSQASRPAAWAAADPFALAAAHPRGDIPVTALQGGNDYVVTRGAAKDFARTLRKAGHQARYAEISGAGHHAILTDPETIRAVRTARPR